MANAADRAQMQLKCAEEAKKWSQCVSTVHSMILVTIGRGSLKEL